MTTKSLQSASIAAADSRQLSADESFDPSANTPAGSALPALTGGLAITVGLWCLWWLLHTPALSTPASVAGPILVVATIGFAALATRWKGAAAPGARIKFGGLIGVVSGCLNLMLLGSMLTQPASEPLATTTQAAADPTNVHAGFEAVRPQLVLVMAGFVVLCGVLGALGGAASLALGATAPNQSVRHWLGRLGIVVAAAVLPLLLLGGLVTSSNAGLSVPDWPGTFGSNMFLYPVSLMDSADPRIFKEHTHRLFGALVGVATLLQMVAILMYDPRKAVKLWGVIAFVLVCAQGLLGAAWVVTVSKFLPVFHGILGQLFFSSMVALAIVLSPRFVGSGNAPLASKARLIFPVTLLALTLQLSFGATYRHLRGQTGASHALLAHIGFSVVAFALVIVAGIIAIRVGKKLAERESAPTLQSDGASAAGLLGGHIRKLGVWLHSIVALQFLLGWIAWAVIATSGAAVRVSPSASELASTPQEPILSVTIRTLHQANGAILLALCAVLTVWLWRLTRSAAADASAAGRAGQVLSASAV